MQVADWGLIDYRESLKRQELWISEIAQGQRESTVVFCSHPAVVTVGRQTQPGDILGWSGDRVEVTRGGRATYHGPNQVVIYPLWKLEDRDVHAYLKKFGSALSQTVNQILQGKGHCEFKMGEDPEDSSRHLTGLWVGSRKLGSVGIAVRKWVTFHGAAVNLDYDASAFRGIQPCGFKIEVMSSIETILGHRVSREHFQETFERNFRTIFCS